MNSSPSNAIENFRAALRISGLEFDGAIIADGKLHRFKALGDGNKKAYRCVGDNNEIRSFDVFSPVVLCGIGSLPGTLHDRSIVIRLERAKSGEVCERFDSRHIEKEKELRRKLARFAADNKERLDNCDPKMPDGAFNRIADNWRPLFAIAEIAGGDWPQRVAAAYAELAAKADIDAQGVGTMLLKCAIIERA